LESQEKFDSQKYTFSSKFQQQKLLKRGISPSFEQFSDESGLFKQRTETLLPQDK
jgi:hypothetical protein